MTKNSSIIKGMIELAKNAIDAGEHDAATSLIKLAKRLVAKERESSTGKKPIAAKAVSKKSSFTTAKNTSSQVDKRAASGSGGGCGFGGSSTYGGGCGH